MGPRTPPGSASSSRKRSRTGRLARGEAGADAIAIAAALAQPFADVVLSGAVTPAQLAANARALAVPADAVAAALARPAEPPEAYWATRAQLPWT